MPKEAAVVLATIERAVKLATGEDAAVLRARPLDEHRRAVEAKHGGRRMRFLSHFPFLGRGSVLHDRTVSHEQVEADLDAALARRID